MSGFVFHSVCCCRGWAICGRCVVEVITRLHVGGLEAQAAHEFGKVRVPAAVIAVAQKAQQLIGGKVVAFAQRIVQPLPHLVAVGVVGLRCRSPSFAMTAAAMPIFRVDMPEKETSASTAASSPCVRSCT